MTRRAWATFVALSIVWGVPYLFIKIAVEELSPAGLVLVRSGIAGLVLLPYALARGGLAVPRRAWPGLAAFAALEMTVPWLALSWAEQHVTSGATGVLVAATPIVAIVMGLVLREEDRPDRIRLAGMGLALVGVVVLLGTEVGADDGRAVAALLLVVLAYAAAPLVVSRYLGGVPAVRVNTWALLGTALLYAPLAGTDLATLPTVSVRTLVAVVLLATVSTALALMLFFHLIQDAGPHRALVVTFVNPVVAVGAGALVGGEPLTAGTALALPLVLVGCVLATRRRPRDWGTDLAGAVGEPVAEETVLTPPR